LIKGSFCNELLKTALKWPENRLSTPPQFVLRQVGAKRPLDTPMLPPIADPTHPAPANPTRFDWPRAFMWLSLAFVLATLVAGQLWPRAEPRITIIHPDGRTEVLPE